MSDIFDGRIARWQGLASEFGARLDSWADLMMIIGGPLWLFRAGAAVAIYSVLEEIAITFTLRQWTANVPTLAAARVMARARRESSALDVRR